MFRGAREYIAGRRECERVRERNTNARERGCEASKVASVGKETSSLLRSTLSRPGKAKEGARHQDGDVREKSGEHRERGVGKRK